MRIVEHAGRDRVRRGASEGGLARLLVLTPGTRDVVTGWEGGVATPGGTLLDVPDADRPHTLVSDPVRIHLG